MQTTARQRPTGISILAIILIIAGILGLLGTILGLVGVAALSGNHSGVISTAATIILIVSAILAVANIVVGWGLWTLKRWAFWTAVIVEAFAVLTGLYSWLGAHNNTSIVGIVIALAILIYLFADRNVRAAFAV